MLFIKFGANLLNASLYELKSMDEGRVHISASDTSSNGFILVTRITYTGDKKNNANNMRSMYLIILLIGNDLMIPHHFYCYITTVRSNMQLINTLCQHCPHSWQ